ncbi:MAG: DUF806 family protein [Lactobacillaceae bacterium]|jgi:hypothetical protein|nr:DUF806 family protein [Lactobacillaceae bacterium]
MVIKELEYLIKRSDLPLDSLEINDEETHGVFSYRVPSELVERDDFTLILLNDIRSLHDEYGGDHATQLLKRFQIQIWYKRNVDADLFEWKLHELLESHGFREIENLGHDVDEETNQLKVELRYEININKPTLY